MKTLRDYINLIESAQQGVAEGASDFVGDSIEALRSSVPGLKQQDFLDELYMYIENQYGQRAAEMMANAGQDDFDEWYDSYLDNPEQGMAEYGDTAKGQKMLTKVQKRAVDRVVSKKADTDPAYAKKNKDTADRAWDRMADKD